MSFWLETGTALVYLVSLPLTGLFALWYGEVLIGFAEEARLFFLHLLRQDLMERLEKRRTHILGELDRGREDYLVWLEEPEAKSHNPPHSM